MLLSAESVFEGFHNSPCSSSGRSKSEKVSLMHVCLSPLALQQTSDFMMQRLKRTMQRALKSTNKASEVYKRAPCPLAWFTRISAQICCISSFQHCCGLCFDGCRRSSFSQCPSDGVVFICCFS